MSNINSGRSVTACINRNIGTAYDNVKKVADDLDNVDKVANDLDNIDIVATQTAYIDVVSNHITNVDTVANNITDVDTVAQNIDAVIEVGGDMPAILSAHDWAVSDEIVNDGINEPDYSSKHYAQSAKASEVIVTADTAVVVEKTDAFNLEYLGKQTTFPTWHLVGALMFYVGESAPQGMYVYTDNINEHNGWLFVSNPQTTASGIEVLTYKVHYKGAADDRPTTFNLNYTPLTLQVIVDGVTMPPSVYSVDGLTLTFNAGLPIFPSSYNADEWEDCTLVIYNTYASQYVGGINVQGQDTADNIYAITDADVGDTWLVTEDGTLPETAEWLQGSTCIWANAGYWINTPIVGIQGEQGPQGIQGPKGDTGYISTGTATLTAGDIDGNSVVFTIPASIPSNVNVLVFRNGLAQEPKLSSKSGDTLTFTDSAFPPVVGEVFEFVYTESAGE